MMRSIGGAATRLLLRVTFDEWRWVDDEPIEDEAALDAGDLSLSDAASVPGCWLCERAPNCRLHPRCSHRL